MVSDELCNTALDLGLGLLSSSSDDSSNKLTRKPSTPQNLDTVREPSLNLSLSGETHDHFLHSDGHIKFNYIKDHSRTVDHLSRQDSGGVASSFSNNLSVKRERLDPHHVVEIEKLVLSKASDEDDDHDDGINGRKKLRLTKSQSALLEESFKLHSTLSPNQKHELARELKLRTRQVEVWFQNRRARSKLKQTEADCELLKKCCENLTEENRRLHRELQHLKTLKLPHHYIQFPTLLCPSCDKNINWLS